LGSSVGKAVLEGDPANNIALAPGDVVTIFSKFSKDDLTVPVTRRSRRVRLEGEVNHAGVWMSTRRSPARRCVSSSPGSVDWRRAPTSLAPSSRAHPPASTRIQQEQRFKEAVDRLEQEIERNATARARNVISPEDAASLTVEAEIQRAMVARLRTLRPTGRVVLELPEHASAKDLPNIEFEDGDRLMVPSRLSRVSVFGSVYNETAFLYRPEKRVADYLNRARGATRTADTGSIYVLRADGSVISKRESGLFSNSLDRARLMPGDVIVVPEEFDRTTLARTLKDWTQILYPFGLGAVAVNIGHL